MVSSPSDGPAGGDQTVSTADPAGHVDPSVSGERLGVIYTGSRYVYGFGPDFYAIWDEYSPGPPVERFPPTPPGRTQGWQRYQTLEPAAAGADIGEGNVALSELELRRMRQRAGRRRWGIVAAVAAVAIIAFVATRAGTSDEGPGSGAGAALPDEAHVDVSGAQTLSEDLTLESATTTGFEGLYPNVQGSWAGANIRLALNFNTPTVGENPTLFNPHRWLELAITLPDETEFSLRSDGGECVVNFTTLEGTGFAGSFTCPDLPVGTESTETIDVEGTFSTSV